MSNISNIFDWPCNTGGILPVALCSIPSHFSAWRCWTPTFSILLHFLLWVVCCQYFCRNGQEVVSVHMCLWKTKSQSQVSFIRYHPFYFWNRVLTGIWNLSNRLNWLASESKYLTVSVFPGQRLQAQNIMPGFLKCVLGSLLRSSWLHSKRFGDWVFWPPVTSVQEEMVTSAAMDVGGNVNAIVLQRAENLALGWQNCCIPTPTPILSKYNGEHWIWFKKITLENKEKTTDWLSPGIRELAWWRVVWIFVLPCVSQSWDWRS